MSFINTQTTSLDNCCEKARQGLRHLGRMQSDPENPFTDSRDSLGLNLDEDDGQNVSNLNKKRKRSKYVNGGSSWSTTFSVTCSTHMQCINK